MTECLDINIVGLLMVTVLGCCAIVCGSVVIYKNYRWDHEKIKLLIERGEYETYLKHQRATEPEYGT